MNETEILTEIRTEPVTVDRLVAMVPEMADMLLDWGSQRLKVTYGYGSHLPIDEVWKPTSIDTTDLTAFVGRATEQGIFTPGQSDLHIEDEKGTIEFRLCHESDLHFASDDPVLVQDVIVRWSARGLTLFGTSGPRKSAFPKEWRKLTG